MSGILDVFQKEQQIQLERFFELWHRKMNFANEFITDEEIKYQMHTFLDDIRQPEKEIIEEVKQLE